MEGQVYPAGALQNGVQPGRKSSRPVRLKGGSSPSQRERTYWPTETARVSTPVSAANSAAWSGSVIISGAPQRSPQRRRHVLGLGKKRRTSPRAPHAGRARVVGDDGHLPGHGHVLRVGEEGAVQHDGVPAQGQVRVALGMALSSVTKAWSTERVTGTLA